MKRETYLSLARVIIVSTYRGYTNLPCLLSSVGVFIFIKQIGQKIKHEKTISFNEWLSGYTFPVSLH